MCDPADSAITQFARQLKSSSWLYLRLAWS